MNDTPRKGQTMKREDLSKCQKCGAMSALSPRVDCRLCRLGREREYQEEVLERALARVAEVQDTLRAIAHERATYRVQVQRATGGGGFSPEYVAMMEATYGRGN